MLAEFPVKRPIVATVISIPQWVTHDLPANERGEVLACVGRTLVIEKVDAFGYVWIGCGQTKHEGLTAFYSGHSFCLPPECLSRA